MALENGIARFMRNTGPARMLIPIGLALVVFGVMLMGFKSENFVETTGKITSVVENVGPDNQKQYDVGIAYAVDGREYESMFPSLYGSFREGADIPVFYNPDDPEQITNSKTSPLLAPILIALGALSMALGVALTRKAFQKSRALDRTAGGSAAARADFGDFKQAPGVTEYYFRFDGNAMRPGYLIEDAGRRLLYEGRMVKNALVGAREFEFRNCVTGESSAHEVGHTVTQSYSDEFFSVSSWFKLDGENVWDVLHGRGLRMTTNLHSRFPRVIYEVTRQGEPFARIETSSMYVHEEDEAMHRLAMPVGNRYYRFWTASDDFDTLFLTIFAISETEQTVVE